VAFGSQVVEHSAKLVDQHFEEPNLDLPSFQGLPLALMLPVGHKMTLAIALASADVLLGLCLACHFEN
jgi:hypothetical protein